MSTAKYLFKPNFSRNVKDQKKIICKIRLKTYGIHHNIKYGHKISLSHRTTRGGPDPLILKTTERAFYFVVPLPYALLQCFLVVCVVSGEIHIWSKQNALGQVEL